MAENQNKRVHPIVQKVLELAHQGFEPIEFDNYAIEQIEEMLAQYAGKLDLLPAVVDLINLAGVLEKQGSHSASFKLMIAISSVAKYLKQNTEESEK